MKLILSISLFAAAIVMGGATPSTVLAAEPEDILSLQCQLPNDRGMRAMGRADCDDEAAALGYKHGVYRPRNASDSGIKPTECAEKDATVYFCVGVPPQGVL